MLLTESTARIGAPDEPKMPHCGVPNSKPGVIASAVRRPGNAATSGGQPSVGLGHQGGAPNRIVERGHRAGAVRRLRVHRHVANRHVTVIVRYVARLWSWGRSTLDRVELRLNRDDLAERWGTRSLYGCNRRWRGR